MPGPLFAHWPALCLATTNPKRLFAGYGVGRCWDFSPPSPPKSPALIIFVSRGSLWHKHTGIHTLTSPRPLLQERSIPGLPPHHLMLQLPLQRDASPRQVPMGTQMWGITKERNSCIYLQLPHKASRLLDLAHGTLPPCVVNQGYPLVTLARAFPTAANTAPMGSRISPPLPCTKNMGKQCDCKPLPTKTKQLSLSLSLFWMETAEERSRVQWKSRARNLRKELTSDSPHFMRPVVYHWS